MHETIKLNRTAWLGYLNHSSATAMLFNQINDLLFINTIMATIIQCWMNLSDDINYLFFKSVLRLILRWSIRLIITTIAIRLILGLGRIILFTICIICTMWLCIICIISIPIVSLSYKLSDINVVIQFDEFLIGHLTSTFAIGNCQLFEDITFTIGERILCARESEHCFSTFSNAEYQIYIHVVSPILLRLNNEQSVSLLTSRTRCSFQVKHSYVLATSSKVKVTTATGYFQHPSGLFLSEIDIDCTMRIVS